MKDYQPISGRDIGGGYISDITVRLSAADQRRVRADRGLCINGEAHGKATHGVRCKRCAKVHRKTA